MKKNYLLMLITILNLFMISNHLYSACEQIDPEIGKRVRSFTPDPDNIHDFPAYQAVLKALAAYQKINYGVGAVIVSKDNLGTVLYDGQNVMFDPTVKYTGHAEMEALGALQSDSKRQCDPQQLTMYTTLEPCVMCFGALLIAGFDTVFYLADDELGGQISMIKNVGVEILPPEFKRLYLKTKFIKPKCSPELLDMARDLFQLSLKSVTPY